MAVSVGGGSRVVMRAAKKALVKRPAYASKGSLVNAQIRAKQIPSSCSNVGKFLGIPEPPRSDISKLISKFIKLNNRQNPGVKKDALTEEKLKNFLSGKEKIGIPEISQMLGGKQFGKSG